MKYIGHGVIDGVECDHLAFRGLETDWQIWVERGAKPIPRKYVITSKTTATAPQYTLRIKSWTSDAPAGADAFAFKAPAGAKLVDVKELKDIDEVPPGQTTASRQEQANEISHATGFPCRHLCDRRCGRTAGGRKAIVLQGSSVTTSADARVGRPLTPVSYAGVARRTTGVRWWVRPRSSERRRLSAPQRRSGRAVSRQSMPTGASTRAVTEPPLAPGGRLDRIWQSSQHDG